MTTEFFWLAETKEPPPMYVAEGARIELTGDALLAHRFDSEAACAAFCGDPRIVEQLPPLVAREHGFG